MATLRFPRYLLLLALIIGVAPVLSSIRAAPELPNFHAVTATLYRGGQPTAAAWPRLAAMGVNTVIDLRRDSEHSKPQEQSLVEASGMSYLSFPMNGFDTPTAAQMDTVLAMMGPGDTVFVHCKVGVDRTGTVVASHRIAREGWDNRRALNEANALGMHWYSAGMRRFILGYRSERTHEGPGR